MARNDTDTDRDTLVSRTRKIHGRQIDAMERALLDDKEECADTLQQLAAAQGAINSLMAEAMEDHIRDHIGSASEEVTDDLLAIVRAYLK
jgi:DNA-binding FrmR family transcriptional regulator